jgi:hypothetical protein
MTIVCQQEEGERMYLRSGLIAKILSYGEGDRISKSSQVKLF